MSNGLPLLSLRSALDDPDEMLRRVPPDPYGGPSGLPVSQPSLYGFKPEAYVPEVVTRLPDPSFGRQVLEGFANVLGGTQLQPGPGATFRTAGLPILGLLASQILTGPIRKGQADRERVNAFLEEEAAGRRSEGMVRRKEGRDAWNKYILDTRNASIDQAAEEMKHRRTVEENQKDRDAAMARALLDFRGKSAGKGTRRLTAEDLKIPGLGRFKVGDELPEDKYLDVITRAPSESAKAAARFGVRAAAALAPIEKPSEGGSLEDRIVAGGNKTLLGLKGPRVLMNTEQKLYMDSRLAWTLAALREESKANITESEYDNVDKAFFAQPGDNAETIANKREMRRVAQEQLEALGEGAGRPPIVEQALRAGGGGAPPTPVKTKIVNGRIVRN